MVGSHKTISGDTAKMQLALRLVEGIKATGLTQASTAAILQIDQPKVSKLMRLHITEFSILRLMRFLTLLDRDIEIIIKNPSNSKISSAGKLSIARKTDVRSH
jgi:predicted XRE-type DNA-binding protein